MTETETTSLEARLRRLEEIVATLEADDVELERALELFEEGVGHIRGAEKILARAELRVDELLGEGDELRTRPLDTASGDGDPASGAGSADSEEDAGHAP